MDGITATIWASQTTLPPAGDMRPGARLTAAAAKTEKMNRTTLTRLVRGGAAAALLLTGRIPATLRIPDAPGHTPATAPRHDQGSQRARRWM